MSHKPIYLFSISKHPQAISINSLDVTFFQPPIDFSLYDYLIITSKQASKALSLYETDAYLKKPALCISSQSALSFQNLGGKVLDVGGGYGDTLVQKIRTYPKTTQWLYLRAEVVASDFVEVLRAEGYSIDEVVVYKSGCSKEIEAVEVSSDAILIFTSPSSVACYLKTHTITPTQTVVVIGKTTQKALPKGVKSVISEETTIQSCIDYVVKHL